MCELNPGVTFQELVARELRAAGLEPDQTAATA
jgi:hypothetical protein